MNQISAEELKNVLIKNSNAELLDVRSKGEFDAAHVVGAKNFPMGSGELSNYINETKDKNEPIYVLCQGGGRAGKVCEEFSGINKNLVLVTGGTRACLEAGITANKGKGVMSIERQARIAAGSLVLLGLLIFKFCCPTGLYLSAFVGAGLIFAGVTDTCAMGLLMMKMPWNNKSECKSCCKL